MDNQSAHTSRVNLHLKKHMRLASALVEKVANMAPNNQNFNKYCNEELAKFDDVPGLGNGEGR